MTPQPIEMADFTKPLNTTYCIDLDTRDRQVKENCGRIKARLEPHPDREEPIAIVCYGPSLVQTWEKLKDYKYIITGSAAHGFLIERGIIPTWHCAVDPRDYQARLLENPHPDVEYLIASVCHKSLLDMLEGFKVKLWHVFAHESDREKTPVAYTRGEWCLTGGSNVGMRQLVVARFLGFKKMALFGMDYSFTDDGTQHAGAHCDETKNIHAVEADGKTYYTSPPMHTYAQQFFSEIRKIGAIDLTVEGDGLLQAKIRELKARGEELIPPASKPSLIAAVLPKTISDEYLALNKQLHEENHSYGTSGSQQAEVVRKLIAAVKPSSVLDYGCGKGTLAQSLSIPIWEYDPAIPGKDAPPRPADLVICTDVLEHIEPEYLDATLLDLSRVTQKVCYAVIATRPAAKKLADGRNAHLIQEGKDWWNAQLSRYFKVEKLEEKEGSELTAVLGPKGVESKGKVIAAPLDFSRRVTPVRHDGTEVKFHTPNDQTLWRAKTLPTKEPATMAWIDTFNEGEVLYDVGANIGGYTVWAAKRRGVKVLAFEPEAANYALLCRNISLNQIDARAYCIALSDEEKLSELYLANDEAGNSCSSFGIALGPDLKERKTSLVQGAVGFRMDSFDNFPAPAHIKIDVDGLEHKVIEGAMQTLRSGTVKSLLIEVNTNLPEHMAMLETLKSLGYRYDAEAFKTAQRPEGPFKGVGECVLTRKNEVEDYVIARLEKAELRTEPFSHLYVEDVFPTEAFAELVNQLPEDYKPLEEARGTKGYPERSVCDTPALLGWMRNGRLRAVLDRKFGVKSKKDETLLIRDVTGYKISPHTDTPSKCVSALFYLTGDHGTSVYTPLIKSFKCKEGKHHEREGFRLHWTAPGKPNSVLIFARTDTSFHGCEPYQGKARDILLYDSRR